MMNRSIIAAVAIAVLASSLSASPSFARTGGGNGGAGASAGGAGSSGGPVQNFDRVPPPHYVPVIAIDTKKFLCGQQFEGRAAYDFDDQSSLYCKQ